MARARVSVTASLSVNMQLRDADDSPLVRKKASVNGLLTAVAAF
jgi:outer membrane scaffolding protein for murein synthesis (MipA/OmpV family)